MCGEEFLQISGLILISLRIGLKVCLVAQKLEENERTVRNLYYIDFCLGTESIRLFC